MVWCIPKHLDPEKLKVGDLLEFLQDGLSRGLSTATLRRQVSAVASILGHPRDSRLSSHPHARKFLRGAALSNSPPHAQIALLGLTPGFQSSQPKPPLNPWPPVP